MMTTLSLIASKKVFEIVGPYETDYSHTSFRNISSPKEQHGMFLHQIVLTDDVEEMMERSYLKDFAVTPAPTFSELIRVLPKIGEKKGWPETHFCKGEISACSVTEDIACAYMLASTEPEGMKAVEEYLLKLL